MAQDAAEMQRFFMTDTRANIDMWQINAEDFPWQGAPGNQLKFLLRYAILAPSVYNTQPWIFSISGDAVQVFVDNTRWLRGVDEDQRDLHLSIGCALENLLVAADHFGYRCQIDYFPSPAHPMLAAIVRLTVGDAGLSPREDPLFEAILRRSTDHHIFSAEPVPPHMIDRLAGCCTAKGIVLTTAVDRELLRQIDALILQADALDFADPGYRKVIANCIKQEVFDTDWLLTKLSHFAASHLRHMSSRVKGEFEILKNASMLGILASEEDGPLTQLKVGQVFERIFLTSVSLGLRLEPITHVLKIPEIRSALVSLPPMQGLIPQIMFRLGNAGEEVAHTPRRPLEEFLRESVRIDVGG